MKVTESESYKIQVLRGLAIIAVVFIHNTPSGTAQIWCRPFLNFSVGLFLFLSGMLSNMEKWNPKKRIIKIIIPYIIWTLIYVILKNIKTPLVIPIKFVEQLLTGRAAAVMYYVFVYCEFTLLIPLIDKLARSKYKYLGFVISPVEIIIMRLVPLIKGYQLSEYINIILSISCLMWFTYYYLGYLLGNKLIKLNISALELKLMWGGGCIILQIIEGYLYLSMGETNCGTQGKLSSVFTGVIFALMAFQFIISKKNCSVKVLYFIGNCSFGIFFSHLAVMSALQHIPCYSEYIIYPFNAVLTIIVTVSCIFIGKNILGKYSKYLAL